MKYFDDEAELDYLQNNLEMVKLAKYIDKQQFGFLSMYFDLDTMEKECRNLLQDFFKVLVYGSSTKAYRTIPRSVSSHRPFRL